MELNFFRWNELNGMFINDFISGMLTVTSLFSFATSNLIRSNEIGTKELQTAMKWGSLVSSSFLVFSVQLGVQTMPNLLSGVLFPANDRSTLKGITRSIQCILLVTVLKVWTLMTILGLTKKYSVTSARAKLIKVV